MEMIHAIKKVEGILSGDSLQLEDECSNPSKGIIY
jgi:hypothetical protein